jgi:PEP-CTERM motif
MNTCLKNVAAACGFAFAAALPAHAASIVTGAQDFGSLITPVTLGYTHSFNDTDPATPGLQLAGVPDTLLSTDLFYDDYAFTVGGSSFSSITATIDLGSVFNISDLRVRLYQGTLQTTTTGTAGPVLIAAWSGQNLVASGSGTGALQLISPMNLAPGSYVFEVRGNVTGVSGGSYAGVLNFASPIPEPGALGLLFAGLGVVAFSVRKRAPAA